MPFEMNACPQPRLSKAKVLVRKIGAFSDPSDRGRESITVAHHRGGGPFNGRPPISRRAGLGLRRGGGVFNKRRRRRS